MRKYTFLLALCWVLILTVSSVGAEPSPYAIDVAHSILDFEVKSFLIDAQGTFKDFQAEVLFDEKDLEKSKVVFTIEAATIDTRIPKRDDHLRSPDFLDVAKYPKITFVSKKVMKTGPQSFGLVGDFTMHGVTKEIGVPVQILRVDMEKNRARFKGEITLKRSDFGITYQSKLNPIDDHIKVALDINIMQPPK